MGKSSMSETEMIAERYQYIENNVFDDVNQLSRNLKVMKYNTDHDWYNCSIISQYEGKDESEVRVYNLYKWREIFEENMNICVPRPGKRVFLLIPVFYEDEEQGTLNLRFDSEEFYYLSALSNNANKTYLCKSQAEVAMEKYELTKKSSILKKGWQERLLEDYLNKYQFYKNAKDQTKEFYRSIMLYTFGSNLLIETHKIGLKYPEYEKDKITIYRNIHQLITSFHIAFKTFLALLNENHRELQEKGLVEDRAFRNGYERLKQLDRGR